MKKFLEQKRIIVLLACGGLIALALLSAALRDFAFQPTEPFSFNFFGGAPALGQAQSTLEIPFWKYILFASLLLVIVVVIVVLIDAEARKRLLLRLFRIFMTAIAILLIMNYAYERGSLPQLLNLAAGDGAGAAATSQANMPEYVPPQINPWVVFAVSSGIGLLLILVGWFIYTRRARSGSSHTLDEIAGIARDALQGLQPGQDWDEAIVRAYIRMNEVVTAERGLIRQPGVTPSEFALRMERAGLPGEAVKSLTRLFEGVRYGGKSSDKAERDLAAAALNAILRACGVSL